MVNVLDAREVRPLHFGLLLKRHLLAERREILLKDLVVPGDAWLDRTEIAVPHPFTSPVMRRHRRHALCDVVVLGREADVTGVLKLLWVHVRDVGPMEPDREEKRLFVLRGIVDPLDRRQCRLGVVKRFPRGVNANVRVRRLGAAPPGLARRRMGLVVLVVRVLWMKVRHRPTSKHLILVQRPPRGVALVEDLPVPNGAVPILLKELGERRPVMSCRVPKVRTNCPHSRCVRSSARK
mmetsp:Transcript_17511/g.45793  ORF Transcript_17511/g.45793 Transcript_17511/m.45793 type:complete len:237 (+) Transcript_17511:1034-1744(+)